MGKKVKIQTAMKISGRSVSKYFSSISEVLHFFQQAAKNPNNTFPCRILQTNTQCRPGTM